MQEMESTKKNWLARERQIKDREAITSREAYQNEHDEQNWLLKTHMNKLELRITDVEEQNRLFKLKLLAS